MAGSHHDAFTFHFFPFLNGSSKGWGFKFEVIHRIFLWRSLYFLGEFYFSKVFIIAWLDKVWRSFSLPSHTLIKIVIFAVVPLLLSHLRGSSFPEAIKEHIIVDLVQLLLENILAFIDITAKTYLDKAIKSLDLDLGVLIAELVGYFS